MYENPDVEYELILKQILQIRYGRLYVNLGKIASNLYCTIRYIITELPLVRFTFGPMEFVEEEYSISQPISQTHTLKLLANYETQFHHRQVDRNIIAQRFNKRFDDVIKLSIYKALV